MPSIMKDMNTSGDNLNPTNKPKVLNFHPLIDYTFTFTSLIFYSAQSDATQASLLMDHIWCSKMVSPSL